MNHLSYRPEEIRIELDTLRRRHSSGQFDWLTVGDSAPFSSYPFEVVQSPPSRGRYAKDLYEVNDSFQKLLVWYVKDGVPTPLRMAAAAASKAIVDLSFIEGCRIPISRGDRLFLHPQRVPAGGLVGAFSLAYLQKIFPNHDDHETEREALGGVCQEFREFVEFCGFSAELRNRLFDPAGRDETEWIEGMKDVAELFFAPSVLLALAGLVSLARPMRLIRLSEESRRAESKPIDRRRELVPVDLAAVAWERVDLREAIYLKRLIVDIKGHFPRLNLAPLEALLCRAEQVTAIMSIDQAAALEGATIAAQLLNQNIDTLGRKEGDVAVFLYSIGSLLVRASAVPVESELAVSPDEAARFQDRVVQCTPASRNLFSVVPRKTLLLGSPITDVQLRKVLDEAKKPNLLFKAFESRDDRAAVIRITESLTKDVRNKLKNNIVPGILRVGDFSDDEEKIAFLCALTTTHPVYVARTLLEAEFSQYLEPVARRAVLAVRNVFPWATHLVRSASIARATGVTWEGLQDPEKSASKESVVNGARGFAHARGAAFDVANRKAAIRRFVATDDQSFHAVSLPLEPATIAELNAYCEADETRVLTISELPGSLTREFADLLSQSVDESIMARVKDVQREVNSGRKPDAVTLVQESFRRELQPAFDELAMPQRDRTRTIKAIFESAVKSVLTNTPPPPRDDRNI